jgi:uncharacterized protein YndB with AHSA1/START domain
MTDSRQTHAIVRGNDLILTRYFDAPRELVWRCWTEPQHVARWFGPRGFETRVEALDLRIGGTSRYVMVGPDGTEYPCEGVFREIEPGRRIVATDEFGEGFEMPDGSELPRGIVTEFVFADEGSGTKVTVTISHPTEADRRRHEEMGVVGGWGSSFECLDEYLAAM